jgi:serine/threonine protein kinase
MIDPKDIEFGEMFYTSSGTRVKLWSGVYLPTGLKVAIKSQPLVDVFALSSLVNEVVLMEKLSPSDSIIKLVGFFCRVDQDENFIYILTEFSSEGDLHKVIRRRKRICRPYQEHELFVMFGSLIRLFAKMQRMGICHRDIKLDNMLVFHDLTTQTDQVKVCDFGVSKLLREQDLLRKTSITGTPYYLSPKVKEAYIAYECGRGERKVIHNEFKSDVYSLGATFLCVACLEMTGALSRYDDLQASICRTIEGLSYSDKIQSVLNKMLTVVEDERPDFIELEAIVQEAWPIRLTGLSVETPISLNIPSNPCEVSDVCSQTECGLVGRSSQSTQTTQERLEALEQTQPELKPNSRNPDAYRTLRLNKGKLLASFTKELLKTNPSLFLLAKMFDKIHSSGVTKYKVQLTKLSQLSLSPFRRALTEKGN